LETLDFLDEVTPSLKIIFSENDEVVLVLKETAATKQGDFDQGRQDLVERFEKKKIKAEASEESRLKKDKTAKSKLTKILADISIQFMLDNLDYHVENFQREKFGALGWLKLRRVQEMVLDLLKTTKEKEAEEPEKKSE